MIKAIKKFIGWDSVGTIVKARLEMLSGAIMAGVASLAAFNFLPYLTDAVNTKMLLVLSGYAFVTGFITELVRRKNASDV